MGIPHHHHHHTQRISICKLKLPFCRKRLKSLILVVSVLSPAQIKVLFDWKHFLWRDDSSIVSPAKNGCCANLCIITRNISSSYNKLIKYTHNTLFEYIKYTRLLCKRKWVLFWLSFNCLWYCISIWNYYDVCLLLWFVFLLFRFIYFNFNNKFFGFICIL